MISFEIYLTVGEYFKDTRYNVACGVCASARTSERKMQCGIYTDTLVKRFRQVRMILRRLASFALPFCLSIRSRILPLIAC